VVKYLDLLTFCSFDFCGRKDLPKENESVTLFTASTSGSCHAFFMWWDLDMDMDGDIQLSCAPAWHQPYSADELQVSIYHSV